MMNLAGDRNIDIDDLVAGAARPYPGEWRRPTEARCGAPPCGFIPCAGIPMP